MSPLDDAVKEIVLKAVDVFFKTNEEGIALSIGDNAVPQAISRVRCQIPHGAPCPLPQALHSKPYLA